MAELTFPQFAKFAKFPQEIRDIVWKYATSLQPRIVEVRFSHPWSGPEMAGHDFVAEIPAILHACHDSRAAGLKVS